MRLLAARSFASSGVWVAAGLGVIALVTLAGLEKEVYLLGGLLMAYGVASIFFFHFAVNIGMTVGLFPVIGIPLPFMSYGGTSLLTNAILLFILIRLDADRQMVLR